jgi:hypothetical protein
MFIYACLYIYVIPAYTIYQIFFIYISLFIEYTHVYAYMSTHVFVYIGLFIHMPIIVFNIRISLST